MVPGKTGLCLYLSVCRRGTGHGGRLIALLLPDMTQASFRLFMDHFKKETKALHGTHPVVLIADGGPGRISEVGVNKGALPLKSCPPFARN